MGSSYQSRKDLASHARYVAPLDHQRRPRQQSFRHVLSRRKPHLGDDTNSSLTEHALAYFWRDYAAGRVNRGRRCPEGRGDEDKKRSEADRTERRARSAEHYCVVRGRSGLTATMTSVIVSSARRAVASISRASIGMDVYRRTTTACDWGRRDTTVSWARPIASARDASSLPPSLTCSMTMTRARPARMSWRTSGSIMRPAQGTCAPKAVMLRISTRRSMRRAAREVRIA